MKSHPLLFGTDTHVIFPAGDRTIPVFYVVLPYLLTGKSYLDSFTIFFVTLHCLLTADHSHIDVRKGTRKDETKLTGNHNYTKNNTKKHFVYIVYSKCTASANFIS